MNIILSNFKLSNFQIYTLICICIIIFRLPFFFTDVFDWDESTYILQGQWIVDGNLTYVDRTAAKPPLLYYLYALFVYFSFGEIYIIRLYTCFLLLINIIFLNKIFRECFNKNFDFILITSFIFSSSFIIRNSNALLSENFAITFLLISLYYFLILKRNIDFFLLGFFLSCACLVRLNLAFLPIIIFFYLIFQLKLNLKDKITKLLLFSFGGILVAIIVIFPYIITNQIDNLYNSVFITGLSMAKNGPYSYLGTLYALLFKRSDFLNFFHYESIFRSIFWISSFFGLIVFFLDRRNIYKSKIIIFYLTIFFSIIIGARAYPHYLILLIPICSIFVAYLFMHIKQNVYFFRLYFFSILICLPVSLIQYDKIIKNFKVNNTFYNGPGFEIASHASSIKDSKDTIYIYPRHIAYWFLKKYPPTDITHPSDINKEFLFLGWGKKNSNKKNEMKKILDTHPVYLILDREISIFMQKFFSINSKYFKAVKSNYILDKKIGYIYIYKLD